jgi:phenylpropionate dioxygenase-like ring-hydroxylating dioxygenase large terminal subunit
LSQLESQSQSETQLTTNRNPKPQRKKTLTMLFFYCHHQPNSTSLENEVTKFIPKWETGEVTLTNEIIDRYLIVLDNDKEWVDSIDDRINFVQSNNTFNDNSTGFIYKQELNQGIIDSLLEIIKQQKNIIELIQKQNTQ